MFETFDGERGGTFCLSKAGLAEGTNANTIQIAAPNGAGVDYCIDGILYHKADTNNIAMNALPAQAALTSCLYCIQIDSGGNVSMKQGNIVTNAALAAGVDKLDFPQPDAGRCALGYLKIRCNNAATFTNGSTDLSATDVVDTFYDTFKPPARGLTS